MKEKKLYRSNNKIVAGVLGGLAEYFNIDPTLIRLIFILIFVFTGFIPGLIAYILALIVMPQKP